jgi:hypothetical protein
MANQSGATANYRNSIYGRVIWEQMVAAPVHILPRKPWTKYGYSESPEEIDARELEEALEEQEW